jgi:nucleoid-associated protein YgaU
MLRAVLSVITVLLFVAMGFLLYTGNYITEKKTESDLTAGAKPPAPPVQPVPAPAPMPVPVLPAPQPQPVVQTPPPPAPVAPKRKRTHVVQPGESLSSISRKYFGTPDYFGKIAEANSLKSKDRIRVGQVLVLPDLPVKTASTEDGAVPVEANVTTPVETAEPATEAKSDEKQASTPDFEPQQPTLNIAVPKK